MTSYQSEKEKILDAVYNNGRMSDWKVSETNSKDLLPWMSIEQASRALDELVKTMVIQPDEFALPGPGYVRNDLRASQRQVMEKGEDKS